jgi:hypothetical protein
MLAIWSGLEHGEQVRPRSACRTRRSLEPMALPHAPTGEMNERRQRWRAHLRSFRLVRRVRRCRVGGGRSDEAATSARPTEPLMQFSRKRLSMGIALLAVVVAHAGNQLQKVHQPVFTVEAGLR